MKRVIPRNWPGKKLQIGVSKHTFVSNILVKQPGQQQIELLSRKGLINATGEGKNKWDSYLFLI